MAKVTVNKPVPVVVPPSTLTLELSIDEARLVLGLVGTINGSVCADMGLTPSADGQWPSYSIYDNLAEALSDLGISYMQTNRDSEALKKAWSV